MTELLISSTESLFVFGSYIFSALLFYVSVSYVYYLTKSSEIKLMNIMRDPRRTARNRKQIDDARKQIDSAIALAEKEKRMIFLWPVTLLKGIAGHAKKKIAKKEE